MANGIATSAGGSTSIGDGIAAAAGTGSNSDDEHVSNKSTATDPSNSGASVLEAASGSPKESEATEFNTSDSGATVLEDAPGPPTESEATEFDTTDADAPGPPELRGTGGTAKSIMPRTS